MESNRQDGEVNKVTPAESPAGVGWAAETDGNPSAAISSAAPQIPGIYDLAQDHLLSAGLRPGRPLPERFTGGLLPVARRSHDIHV